MPSTRIVHGSYAAIAAALAERIRRERGGRLEEWLASPVEIVVASRSAAEEIARRLLDDGVATAGVSLLSPERLAARIVNDAGEYPRLASDGERALAMELARRETDDPLAETHGIASMLLRSWRDMRDSGVTLAEFRRRVANDASLRDRRRSLLVATIWQRFEQLLATAGAADMAELFDRASRAVASGAPLRPQIVFGFYDATGMQARLFEALAAAGKLDSVYLPVPLDPDTMAPDSPFEFAAPFVRRIVDRGASSIEPAAAAGGAPDWTIHAFDSPQDELREVCRAIRALADAGEPLSGIAVAARAISGADARLLRGAGARFGLTFSGLPSPPVASNRVARGVLLCLGLQGRRFLRREVIEIVRSGLRPLTPGRMPSLDELELATRRAEISRGGSAEIRVAAARARYGSGSEDPALHDYAAIVERLEGITRGFTALRHGAQWAASLEGLAELFDVETDADVAAVDAIRATASTLRRAPFSGSAFDADSISRLVEGSGELPDNDAGAGPIRVGDVMRLRGISVRHLFVIRGTHGIMPQRRVEDALLPDPDRARLGIRQVGDGRDEERLLFEILASSAMESIHFSFAVGDGLGHSSRASQLLKDYAIARDPASRRAILKDFPAYLAARFGARPRATRESTPSATETRTRLLLASPDAAFTRKLQLHAMRGTGSRFDGFLPPGPGLDAPLGAALSRISPSRFEQLGECPQRFFVSSVLRAREVEEPEPGAQIEIRKRGLVDHEVLQLLYESLDARDWDDLAGMQRPALTPRIEAKLETAVDAAFASLEKSFPPVNARLREIERAESRHQLATFAGADLHALVTSGFRPLHFELELDARDHASRFDVGGMTVAFQGRIDRVDSAEQGTAWRVVDYKSGKGDKYKKLEQQVIEGRKLQLAIYGLVALRRFAADPSRVTARVLPLRSPGVRPDKFTIEMRDVAGRLEEVFATLVGGARAGRFPAIPSERDCEYCLVGAWCRTRHDERESAAAQDAGSALEQLAGRNE